MTAPHLEPGDRWPSWAMTPEEVRIWFRRRWGRDPRPMPNDAQARTDSAEPNAKALKYSDDQPRDDSGRWTSGGGGGSGGTATGTAPNDVPEAPPGAEPTPDMLRLRDTMRRAAGEHVGRTDGYPDTASRPAMSTRLANPASFAEVGSENLDEPVLGVPGPRTAFTEAVRDLPYETGAAYDDNGNALVEGTNYAFGGVNLHDWERVEGAAVFVHNHPLGEPPSPRDLAFAVEVDIGEMQVPGRLVNGDAVDYRIRMPAPAHLLEVARANEATLPVAIFRQNEGRLPIREQAARVVGRWGDFVLARAHQAALPQVQSLMADGMTETDALRQVSQNVWGERMPVFAKTLGATYEVKRSRGK